MIIVTYVLLVGLLMCIFAVMYGVSLILGGHASGIALLCVYVFNIVMILLCLNVTWSNLGGVFYV